MPRAAKSPKTGVTPQQHRFSYEYVRTGKPSRAYRLAYDASKSNSQTVATNANKLLNNPYVAPIIKSYLQAANRAMAVSVESIAKEYARIAFFDPRDLYDDDGRPLTLPDLSEDAARVIAGVDLEGLYSGVGEDRKHVGMVRKYRFVNKLGALDSLANWKKMLIDRSEVGQPGEFAEMSDEELDREIRAVLIAGLKDGVLKMADPEDKTRKSHITFVQAGNGADLHVSPAEMPDVIAVTDVSGAVIPATNSRNTSSNKPFSAKTDAQAARKPRASSASVRTGASIREK